MKTLYKTATILALLGGLALAAQAQTVIGSWLSAPIPPSTANDEGWQRGQSGFGPNGSIFASSNMPAFFELKAGVAAGYAQSLDIHETGYGNVRLYISLSAAQIAAFTNNSQLNFTVSVQPGDAGTPNGYIQLIQFQYNYSGSSSHNISPPSTTAGFSETGDTGNNSSGQPIFYYYTSASARQQVVTWNYSSVLTNIVGSSYLQFVWVFQTSGGELTNIYINNITLSGAAVPAVAVIVDQFNPTNNPYAGTNVYAVDHEITNVYNLWAYGGNNAVDPTNIIWDSTQNCTNTPNADTHSGALKLIANFAGNNQFVIWNRGPGNTFAMNPPSTNGYGLLTFEFDVKYDPSSQIVTNGIPIFGHLEWGVVPSYTLAVLGSVEVPATNTGWMHVTIPLNPLSDSDLLNISSIFFKQYSGYYGGMNGTSILWLDNLKFTYTNVPPVIPPPIVAIEKAVPGLRLFSGGTNQNGRTEVFTAPGYQNQSWVGATIGSPVSYSFKVKNIPANMNQTHIFLIPVSGIPDTAYNGQDYNASSGLWLTIGTTGIGQVSWKTNWPGHNAYDQHIAGRMTNSTAVGTWTLSFTSATSGTVTGPDGNPVAFTITNGAAATDFANPVAAFFGCQPNGTAGIGGYEDWISITITGTAQPISEDFTTEPGRTLTKWSSAYGGAALGAAVVVSTNDMPAYWVNWTTGDPTFKYDIGSKTNLLTPGPWISPQYYSGYFDNTAPYGAQQLFGPRYWVLEPKDDLPTANGLPGGPLAPNAFFLVATNVAYP